MNTKVNLLHEPTRQKPWIVRWYAEPDGETGKQRRMGKSFAHSRDAKAFLADRQVEVDRYGPQRKREAVPLAQLIEEFRESRLASVGHTTRMGYEHTLKQLLSYFGNHCRSDEITQRRAEAFLAGRKRMDGKKSPLASWTMARYLCHCRALFAASAEWGYALRNPFVPEGASAASPLRVRPKSRCWHHLRPEELRQLLLVVPEARVRAGYWLMYGCGLRAGELYNLRSENVDIAAGRVHVVNRPQTAGCPPFTVKSDGQSIHGKERSVPIPAAALPSLTETLRSAFRSGGFVALSPERYQHVIASWRLCYAGEPWGRGDWRPWRNSDMLNNFLRNAKGYLGKAGLELSAPFTLHTFRKSFAQNHADAGTPPRTLAKLLGHSDTRVTMEFYNRVTDANERAAAEAMDRLLACDDDSREAMGIV